MSGHNLYERVRAAYGLDEDDVLRDLSTGPSGRPTFGRGGSRGGRGGSRTGSVGGNNINAGHNRPDNSTISPAASFSGSWSILNGAEKNHENSYCYAQSPGYISPDNTQLANTYAPHPFDERPALQTEAAAASPPVEVTPLKKVNSVRVPFDPEDQSDDEVMIATAYNRKLRSGECAQPALETPDPGGSQLVTKSMSLSPTAAPFHPKTGSTGTRDASAAASDPAQPPPKPLVHIAGATGPLNSNVEVGQAYPGSRNGFCPWALVANYHLWFVGRQNSERIKPYFEKGALLQAQAWDFCYLWQPVTDEEEPQNQTRTKTPQKHVLLVPTSQFQHFMNRINQTLGIQLIVPPGPSGEKFRVIFGQQKTPVPRFLGRAADETALASIVRNMPAINVRDGTDRMKPQAKKMYEKKVAGLVVRYDRDKMEQKLAKAEKNRLRRKTERQTVGRQIKRVQRYLGLRHKSVANGQRVLPGPLDLTQPPPYVPEDDVIFVSMDIESYEYNHRALTEIGFGILDARDIAGVPPGSQCEQWFKLIQARHVRIREHVTMVNRSFVRGCEENFNFGTSEFVKLSDVLYTITRILQPRLANGELRKVVLLGHDTKSDIALVENVGFFVKDEMFLEVLDTQDIHQHFRMRSQQMGLRGVLNDLEIEHSFLHNGGNDAVYTLQAMISLVVKKRQESLRRQTERLQPGFSADAEVVAQGWASGGEFTDGG